MRIVVVVVVVVVVEAGGPPLYNEHFHGWPAIQRCPQTATAKRVPNTRTHRNNTKLYVYTHTLYVHA